MLSIVHTEESGALSVAVVTFSTPKGLVRVNAEVAETPLEKQRGLMFRRVLAEDAGMLFVFEQDQPLTFWMMNTSIALDGVFISSQLRVVFVEENLTPCPPPNCDDPQYFSSPTPAQYVLEVNAGFAKKHTVTIGTQVAIETGGPENLDRQSLVFAAIGGVVLALGAWILHAKRGRRGK
jgi:hypothetical protein